VEWKKLRWEDFAQHSIQRYAWLLLGFPCDRKRGLQGVVAQTMFVPEPTRNLANHIYWE
jgi:hypothetical protein